MTPLNAIHRMAGFLRDAWINDGNLSLNEQNTFLNAAQASNLIATPDNERAQFLLQSLIAGGGRISDNNFAWLEHDAVSDPIMEIARQLRTEYYEPRRNYFRKLVRQSCKKAQKKTGLKFTSASAAMSPAAALVAAFAFRTAYNSIFYLNEEMLSDYIFSSYLYASNLSPSAMLIDELIGDSCTN